MNKIKISALVIGMLFLSGCSAGNKPEQKIPEQPQAQDTGYLSGMVGIKNEAEKNIQNATDAENKRLQNTLSEGDNKNNTNINNMDYVKKYSSAVLNTNFGKITLKFNNEATPVTVNNFLKLAAEKFYDGTKFHRVIKGFMIQGGDPNSKDDDWSNDGQGGPGYTIPAEIKLKNTRGTIATARLGDAVNPKKDSSGSQFYINTVDNTSLDGQYTVFGEVTEGMDVALKIENVKTNANDHPTEDVVIQSIELIAK